AYLIQPDLPKDIKYEENPLLYFREKGYLANPKHLVFQSGRVYEVNENEVEKGAEDLLTPELLEVLANDEIRNYRIVERLLEIPRGKQTLVYTCT
ncbi:hypothetical protein AOA60_12655, partial [Pseudomonas sp. 2822-17]